MLSAALLEIMIHYSMTEINVHKTSLKLPTFAYLRCSAKQSASQQSESVLLQFPAKYLQVGTGVEIHLTHS